MKNLYLWLQNAEERRAFVVELLEIPTERQRNGDTPEGLGAKPR